MFYWPFSSEENEEFYEKIVRSNRESNNETFTKRRKKVEDKINKDKERIKKMEEIKLEGNKRKDEQRSKRREKYKEK